MRSLPALALLAVALGIFVAHHHHCLYDDAFIYLRYVRNIGAGCGVRWNCGEAPVEGFSSPLYLLLLVLGSLLTSKLVLLTTVVSTAALFGACGLAIVGASAGESPLLRSLAVAALLAFDHCVLLNAVIGMDSGLASLFVAGAWLLVERGRWRAATALVALSLAARPEMVVFAIVLPFVAPAAERQRTGFALGAAFVGLTLLRWLVFRDVMPNTYWAKSGGTWRHLVLGFEYVAMVVRDFPLVAAAPLALLDRERRRGTGFLLAGALLWFVTFLRSGGDTFSYGRLAFPLVPALSALAVRGAFSVFQRRHVLLRAAPFVVAAGVAAWRHDIPTQHVFDNVNRWIVVGRYLAQSHAGKTIATVPIGAIGYTSKLPLLDLVGLTDRTTARARRTVPSEMLTRQWIGHERHDLDRFAEVAPDLVVTTKFDAEPWTLERAEAGFYADWLILRGMKEGRLPYDVLDAEIAPGVHWLFFQRRR